MNAGSMGPMGLGSYVGEIRQGPDGQLYEWVEGVDGLGNPVGFWKALKAVGRAIGKGVGRLRRLLPTAAGCIPGAGPVIRRGLRAAKAAGFLGLGIGDYPGELRQAEDGNLYQWEEGMDAQGNPIGYWRA